MTTNQLTPQQIATAGMLLEPKGWGYGMAVAAEPDEISAVPGRYGWDGGYGTVWFNDPHRGLIAIALTPDLRLPLQRRPRRVHYAGNQAAD